MGKAVVRNRIRRRIRAVIREIDGQHVELPQGGDHLVRVTAPIDHWSHAELHRIMTELLTPTPASGPAPSTAPPA